MAKTASSSSQKAAVTKGKSTLRKSNSGSGGTKASTGMGKKILLAIAQKHKLGEEAPDRREVAAVAAYPSNKMDSFRVTCNNHKKKGLVEFPDSKTIKLTPAGWKDIEDDLDKLPKTNEEVQQTILDEKQIKGGNPTKIFKLLLDGRARTKEEIAEAIGCDDYEAKKDSIRVQINTLNQFTEKTDDGKIRLSDKVFPFGRPEV